MKKQLPVHLEFASLSSDPAPIPHLGHRYDTSGTFLTERGNTVVCHLAEGSETEALIQGARQRFLDMPGADKLAFTASSSLHMTLFQGVIETRRAAPYWPENVPVETPIDDMTAIFMDRLAGFQSGKAFAVEVVHATPLGLTLGPATERDRVILKDWRDRLADLLGYRHPDHDTYVFHITFAYMIERFDDQTLSAWAPVLEEIAGDLRRKAPTLQLKAPAFCAFDDMNHFEELMVFEPT